MSYDGFEVELEDVFVDAEPVPTSTNRSVLAWAAGVVAVLALLAWWASRGSDPGPAADSPPESGSAAEPGANPTPVEPDPAPGEPALASDGAADGTDGSDAESGTGDSDGYAAGPAWAEVGEGSGYDLLAIDRQGNVAVLDFDTGSVSRFGLQSIGRGFGTAGAVLRVGGQLAAVYEGKLILAGAESEPEVLADQLFGWRAAPGDPPVFWGYSSEGLLFTVPVDGSTPINLPGEARPVAVWDRQMLIQAVNDIVLFPLDEGPPVLYAHGRVVSASSGAVAYQSCDLLECRFLVGRPGEPEWIEVPEWTETAVWSEVPQPPGVVVSLSVLSPDGAMMIRPRWWETGAGLLLHDLVTGTLRRVIDVDGVLPFDTFLRRAVWSPDNRLAVIKTGPAAGPGEFRVVRTDAGTSARLPDDLVQVIELVPDPSAAG